VVGEASTRCKPCFTVKIAELGVLPDIVRMET
jgi:hypothetical protein